jgi:molybdate transport system ATP-binding protein
MMKLDVNIRVTQGRFVLNAAFRSSDDAFGIFGPSGCGKSTLFRALSGLVKPNAGSIQLNDETLFDSDRKVFVPPHKRGIGLVFQDARLFPHWTAEENLRAGEQIRRHRGPRPFSFDDIVGLLAIDRLIGRSVNQLSGGEKQRVALGRALLSNPRLLLMDEPVTGLDVSLKAQILPFLSEVHRALKIPTVLISHDLNEILQLTDRILLIRQGEILGSGPLGTLVQDPEMLRALKGTELTNVLRTHVKDHDVSKGVTLLEVPGATDMPPIVMELLNDQLNPGNDVTIGICASQIALAPQRIEAISMRNQFPARVTKIVHTPDRSICCLETAAGPMFAEITPGTEQDMNLKEGAAVWGLFKSRAVKPIGVAL